MPLGGPVLAILLIGCVAVIAGIGWLLYEKRNIAYDRRSADPRSERRVIYATLVGVGGIAALALATFMMAFS